MKLPSDRAGLLAIWYWLYIGIGLCSLAAGLYLLYVIRQMGRAAPQGLGFIAFVLVLFGPIRIVNSVWVHSRNRKRSRSKVEL